MARPSLFNNPKFKRLVVVLALPRPYVLGHLELLWHTAYECGNPRIGDSLTVEAVAEWVGEPGKLTTALRDCRLLDEQDGEFYVHDLFDHAPEYVNGRAKQEEERKREKMCAACHKTYHSPKYWAKFCSDNCRLAAYRDRTAETQGNGLKRKETQQCVSETHGNGTPAPAPAPHLPSEDKSGEVSPRPSCPEAEIPPSGPEALTWPTVGKEKSWTMPTKCLTSLRMAFPDLDVLAECRKSLAWIEADPKRRKTAGGMRRHLFGWMSRAQNNGRARDYTAAKPDNTAARKAETEAIIARQREIAAQNRNHTTEGKK
jgi:hypothetical protein